MRAQNFKVLIVAGRRLLVPLKNVDQIIPYRGVAELQKVSALNVEGD
jgi:hypothetical protein